jgi:hypothetical protein
VLPVITAGRDRPGLIARRSLLRREDWLLAGYVALATPLFAMIEGLAGPFDSDRPLEGIVRLAAAGGSLACLATRNSDAPEREPPILTTAAAGPIVAVVALAGASAFAALGLSSPLAFVVAFAVAMIIALAQSHRPAWSVAVRRALAAPFSLAAAGIFWGFVASIATATDVAGRFMTVAGQFVLLIALVASGMWYGLFVYAPRQIVEPEGDVRAWLTRYAVFVAAVVAGLSWYAALA